MPTFKNSKRTALQPENISRSFPTGFEVVEWAMQDGLCVVAPFVQGGNSQERYWLQCLNTEAARELLYQHPLWMLDRESMLKRSIQRGKSVAYQRRASPHGGKRK